MDIGTASATTGIVCLVAAVLVWNLWPSGPTNPAPRWVVLLLALTGSTAVAGSPVGARLREKVGAVDTRAGELLGDLTGTVVTGMLGLAALAVVAIGISRGLPWWTMAAALVLPVVMVTIPGPLGELLTVAVTNVANLVGWLVAAPLGLT